MSPQPNDPFLEIAKDWDRDDGLEEYFGESKQELADRLGEPIKTKVHAPKVVALNGKSHATHVAPVSAKTPAD